jgi:hypothetical protein
MKDLTDMVFGEMVVLGFAGYSTPRKGKPRPKWWIRCSCGKEKAVLGTTLRNTKVVSCGHNRGFRKLPNNAAAINLRFGQYAKSAVKMGREFSITREQFATMLAQNCVYCGTPPASVVRARGKHQEDFWYNGVDRVDNSLGYIPENCVPCCATCNLMKRGMSVSEFVAHAEKITTFNNDCPNKPEK